MNLMQRLSTAWHVLVSPSASGVETEDEPTVALRRDLATAQLELQESRDALRAALARADALEKAQAAQVRDGVESHLETLFADLAAPLSQLRMQAALLAAGTVVAASDVMTLARRCAEVVEGAGLEAIGATGEMMPFDPEIAQPLAGDVQMAPGDTVHVRFIGYRYHGRVLRKALVEHKEA